MIYAEEAVTHPLGTGDELEDKEQVELAVAEEQ